MAIDHSRSFRARPHLRALSYSFGPGPRVFAVFPRLRFAGALAGRFFFPVLFGAASGDAAFGLDFG
ncbi:MAG TPA: hypothetical protein VM925_27675, partial [Labilithrix sp.]|nr:hypothetical protein [Labilithrix sp.]